MRLKLRDDRLNWLTNDEHNELLLNIRSVHKEIRTIKYARARSNEVKERHAIARAYVAMRKLCRISKVVGVVMDEDLG